nr:MAPEG family protein [Aurantiacibacter marinus]
MALLQPLVVLAGWTMVMWLWMYAARLPAMSKANIDPDSLARDPAMSLDRVLPPDVQWKAHNFNHLHEAPTVFYAVMLGLALLYSSGELTAGLNIATWLAWAYAGLRIVHSLVQATINKVAVRFVLFCLSQTALSALILIAVLIAFGLI